MSKKSIEEGLKRFSKRIKQINIAGTMIFSSLIQKCTHVLVSGLPSDALGLGDEIAVVLAHKLTALESPRRHHALAFSGHIDDLRHF